MEIFSEKTLLLLAFFIAILALISPITRRVSAPPVPPETDQDP